MKIKRIIAIILVLGILLLQGCSTEKNFRYFQDVRGVEEYTQAFFSNEEYFNSVAELMISNKLNYTSLSILASDYSSKRKFQIECHRDDIYNIFTKEEISYFYELSRRTNIHSFSLRDDIVYLSMNTKQDGMTTYIYDRSKLAVNSFTTIITDNWKVRRMLGE